MTQFLSTVGRAWGGNLHLYCFLTLAFLLMALNVIVGRVPHTEIPPLGLSF